MSGPRFVGGVRFFHELGKTTSAAYGYRVGRPIALAYLQIGDVGEIEHLQIHVDIARERFLGTASLFAAFDPRGDRLRTTGAR
jgi:glycine cleavage system aminomethyltransferase T